MRVCFRGKSGLRSEKRLGDVPCLLTRPLARQATVSLTVPTTGIPHGPQEVLKEQKRKEAQLRHDRLVDDDRKKKEARKAEQVRPSSAYVCAPR